MRVLGSVFCVFVSTKDHPRHPLEQHRTLMAMMPHGPTTSPLRGVPAKEEEAL